MSYAPPIEEQKFVLDHVVGIADLLDDRELVAALVDGAGQLARLNRSGREVGAKWSPETVTMPPGFRDAYRAYVEGGWGTLAGPPDQGGQGLPLVLASGGMEALGSGKMGFSLLRMLPPAAVEALKHHGTAELQQAWLPKLITGEWTGTMNLTESHAGSDVGALKNRAEH